MAFWQGVVALVYWLAIPTLTNGLTQWAVAFISTGAGKIAVGAAAYMAWNAWQDARRIVAWRAAELYSYCFSDSSSPPLREPPNPEVQPPWHKAIATAVDFLAYLLELAFPYPVVVVFRWFAPVVLLAVLVYEVVFSAFYFLSLAAAEFTSPKATPRITKQPVLAIALVLIWQLVGHVLRFFRDTAPSDVQGHLKTCWGGAVADIRAAGVASVGGARFTVNTNLNATASRVKAVLEEQLQFQKTALSQEEREDLHAAATSFRRAIAQFAQKAKSSDAFVRVRRTHLRDPTYTEVRLREGCLTFEERSLKDADGVTVKMRVETADSISGPVNVDADVFALLNLDDDEADCKLVWQDRPAQDIDILRGQLEALQAAFNGVDSRARTPRGRGTGPARAQGENEPPSAGHQATAGPGGPPAAPRGARARSTTKRDF
jgi:hypothetical protein